MPWIESHQKLRNHPKLLSLCAKTGWDQHEAIGKLHIFWWWVLDYAEDGDLSKYNPEVFLGEIRGEISTKNLLKIFQDLKFIEKNFFVHDWLDYAGRYLYSKYHSSNPKIFKKIQRKHKGNSKVNLRSSYLTTKGNLPNLTIPNLTYINNGAKSTRFAPPSLEDVGKYCKERKNAVSPESFINFYESKGWMVGKNKMKDWRAAVRTWESSRKNENQSKDNVNYISIIEQNLGKIATKDRVKTVMKIIPEQMWWKIDTYLKKRYPGGGDSFSLAESETIKEKHGNLREK